MVCCVWLFCLFVVAWLAFGWFELVLGGLVFVLLCLIFVVGCWFWLFLYCFGLVALFVCVFFNVGWVLVVCYLRFVVFVCCRLLADTCCIVMVCCLVWWFCVICFMFVLGICFGVNCLILFDFVWFCCLFACPFGWLFICNSVALILWVIDVILWFWVFGFVFVFCWPSFCCFVYLLVVLNGCLCLIICSC